MPVVTTCMCFAVSFPVQLLVFVVNPRAGFPWKSSTIAPLQTVAHFSILSGYYEIIDSAELYLALVFATGDSWQGEIAARVCVAI